MKRLLWISAVCFGLISCKSHPQIKDENDTVKESTITHTVNANNEIKPRDSDTEIEEDTLTVIEKGDSVHGVEKHYHQSNEQQKIDSLKAAKRKKKN